MTVASMFRRMAGAARLEVAAYEEVEADRSAKWQAVPSRSSPRRDHDRDYIAAT